VFDARGLLHSLHALARVRIGSGEVDRAADLLDEAERLATSLGEPLEHAKITLTRAKLAARDGERDRALALVDDALLVFTECGTSFDIAHARLARAEMLASGDARRRTWEGAGARAMVARRDFGLLRRNFPAVLFPYDAGIIAGLVAYACGDAFGLPWEGSPPSEVDMRRAASLPARPGWSRGATSDDTALTLLVAQVLTSSEPQPADRFLWLLSDQAATIPGLGPSTTAAIRAYVETGRPPVTGGQTNGAAMRALPVGWIVPLDQPERRRELTISLSAATHPYPEAQCAACVLSACASWALERLNRVSLIEVAQEEAAAAVRQCRADPRIELALAAIRQGEWSPPPSVRHSSHAVPPRGAVVCRRSRIAARRHRGGRHPRRRPDTIKPSSADCSAANSTLARSARCCRGRRRATRRSARLDLVGRWRRRVRPVMADIVVFGVVAADVVVRTGTAQATRCGEGLGWRMGGSSANVACGLSSAGHNVRLAGPVGTGDG
jgi:hypothetical protein